MRECDELASLPTSPPLCSLPPPPAPTPTPRPRVLSVLHRMSPATPAVPLPPRTACRGRRPQRSSPYCPGMTGPRATASAAPLGWCRPSPPWSHGGRCQRRPPTQAAPWLRGAWRAQGYRYSQRHVTEGSCPYLGKCISRQVFLTTLDVKLSKADCLRGPKDGGHVRCPPVHMVSQYEALAQVLAGEVPLQAGSRAHDSLGEATLSDKCRGHADNGCTRRPLFPLNPAACSMLQQPRRRMRGL
jgi:hypothetical protein